ncbi:MAG: YihA family ribosome biogenesis GTP-binding protein [Chloracidobacterium sp.]|nr:YihA family ribosome biogenesis GTP-binding protein [Chloracidobacterium sp.]MCC6826412.1 YihA family ribosome biogenesis GTP-binding protein [Acidobacteriota bacterium]MCO5334630.1 ribosome biogenesis GTP-binding protein YihA/YsxC [Pyrinomonadaceae bacterium]
MKISSAEFVKSAFERSHWPVESMSEIAFLGRSNVGKSSLINSLLGRKGLARTSNTPGRTQSINFFKINGSFLFADLPGYGFAKVSKTMRAGWGKMAEEYLFEREELVLCIQLVDARHPPSKLDIQLNEWLRHHDKPFIVVATKSDKLSANDLAKNLKEIRRVLPAAKILPHSAAKHKGNDDVWAAILAAVEK